MRKVNELIDHWREIGPALWAEGPFGWIDINAKPIILEPWQKVVLATWWAHRDVVTTLAISNIKKTGKTFLNAVLLAWRWLALPGEHFAVGNDLDQSAGRQFQQVMEMVRRHPYLKNNTKISKKQLMFLPTGSVIKALSVDAAGNAGANHLTASHTEAWGIIYESGIRAFEELTPPPGRFYELPSLRICDSYGGFIGESETWHNLIDRGLKGERILAEWPIFINGGILTFHITGTEAQERCFRGTPKDAATYYADQKATLRDGAYLRLHENQRTTGDERFIPLEDWKACIDKDHRPILLGRVKRLFIGVDGAIKHDSAAVVAVYKDLDIGKVVLARHRIWKPSAKDPLDLDSTIGDFLRELHKNYRIQKVYYDPYQLHDLSTRLRSDGLPMEEYPQSSPNLTVMGQNLYELIQAGNLLLYPDDELLSQAASAIAVETPRGWRIAKEKSSHKIDAIIALALAARAAVDEKIGATWDDVENLGRIQDYKCPWTVGLEDNFTYPWHSGN